MPEQNTNRLWFALGAIIIGAMLFFTYRDSAEGTVKKIFEGFNVGLIDAIDKDTTSPGGSDTNDPDNTYTYYKIREASDSSSEVWVRTEMLDNGHVRIVDAGAKDKFKDNTYGSGLTGKISFPDTVGDGLVIEVISANAMKNAKFDEVMRLPEELLVLDDYALQQSYFSGVAVFPHALEKIGIEALRDSKFTGTMKFPKSLKDIGEGAFGNSEFTGTVNVPEGTTTIGDGAFENSKLTGSLSLPSTVTSIGESAFENSVFTGKVSLPNNLTDIGDNAFKSSVFTGTLSLPASVESIGDNAFNSSNFSGTFKGASSLKSIGNNALSNSLFTQIDLSTNIELGTIGDKAFEKSVPTGNILLPNSVRSIGERAFYSAKFSNKNLVLPSKLEHISAEAFYSSLFVGSLTMDDNLTYIGDKAFFSGFANANVGSGDYEVSLQTPSTMTQVIEPKATFTYGFSALDKYTLDKYTLNMSKKLEYIGASAFYKSNFAGDFIMPASLKYIGDTAFYSSFSGYTVYISDIYRVKAPYSPTYAYLKYNKRFDYNLFVGNNAIEYIGSRAFASARFKYSTSDGITSELAKTYTALPIYDESSSRLAVNSKTTSVSYGNYPSYTQPKVKDL